MTERTAIAFPICQNPIWRLKNEMSNGLCICILILTVHMAMHKNANDNIHFVTEFMP